MQQCQMANEKTPETKWKRLILLPAAPPPGVSVAAPCAVTACPSDATWHFPCTSTCL